MILGGLKGGKHVAIGMALDDGWNPDSKSPVQMIAVPSGRGIPYAILPSTVEIRTSFMAVTFLVFKYTKPTVGPVSI